MAALDFVFTLHLSADGRLDETRMLNDLTTTVLRHAGYAEPSTAAVVAELDAGIAAGRTGGVGCDVEFRAHDGEIAIVVSQGSRTIYRLSRRLP